MNSFKRTGPGIAILDIDMPNRDGFVVAGIPRTTLAGLAIFLTMHKKELHSSEAIDRCGVDEEQMTAMGLSGATGVR